MQRVAYFQLQNVMHEKLLERKVEMAQAPLQLS